MTDSIYSHKNRRYKPLVEEGMKALLTFFAEMDKLIMNNKQWKLTDLAQNLEGFGSKMVKILGGYDSEGEAVFTANEHSHRHLSKYYLKIPPYEYKIDRNNIRLIHKCLKMLHDRITKQKVEKSESENALDFLFIGEKRIIDTGLLTNLSMLSQTELQKLIDGTKIPSVNFEESAIEAIKKGGDQFQIKEGFEVSSKIKFSYSIIPVTDFADTLVRAYYKNTTPLPEPLNINGNKIYFTHRVPSIFNEKSETLFQLVSSLVIQYYISFSGFDQVKSCEICNTLFYATRTDKTICGDGSCKGIRNAKNDPRKDQKKKCKLRNNRWYGRRVNKKLGPKDFVWKDYSYCEDCDVDPLPYAGKCPKLQNEFQEELVIFDLLIQQKEQDKQDKLERIKLRKDKAIGVQPDIRNFSDT